MPNTNPYSNEGDAIKAFNGDNCASNEKEPSVGATTLPYEADSVSVDAACSGNPGVLEFRGVITETGEQLFKFGPFPLGTNNIGEFLALVYVIENCPGRTIYTDSVTALAWLRNKKISTNLERNADTAELWQLIDESLEWLHNNSYTNKILKWDTKAFGDIKADYGRK